MQRLYKTQKKVSLDQFEFSKHAVDQSIVRDISVQEVREALNNDAKIIEDYPMDKYGPSCLILENGSILKNGDPHEQNGRKINGTTCNLQH